LKSINVQKNHKPLYMAAVKRFKSWGKAVKTAGIDYECFLLRKRMSKAEIKRQILKLHDEKVDLAYPNMRENYSNLLAAGMKKLGHGSWALARKKCGIWINYRLPKHKRNNNVIEQVLRSPELGRKNYVFLGRECGGKTAAILYTLICSCKANGIDPYEYLKDVLARINSHPHSKLHELLPHNWARLRKQTQK
jgi:hypothetical protein